MSAIGAVVFLGTVAAAAVVVDGNTVRNQRLLLQSVADIAATAGVKSVAVGQLPANAAIAITEANLPTQEHENVLTSGNVELGVWSSASHTFSPGGGLGTANAVRVTLQKTGANGNPVSLALASVLGSTIADVQATATAALLQRPLCVLALDPSGDGIRLTQNNDIFAQNCTLWSNATHSQSVAIMKHAGQIDTGEVRPCAVGQAYGAAIEYSAYPIEDCSAKQDPLINFPLPSAGGCDFNNVVIKKNDSAIFTPGTYCNGVEIKVNADPAVFLPGVYVFKGGDFHISNNNEISGQNVLFHFTDGANWYVENNVEVELSGRESGAYAGLVVSQSRDSAGTFTIESNTDFDLTGVVYLANSTLGLGADTHMSINAPWAGFIVADLVMWANGDLTLNMDYAATPVPLPDELERMFTTVVQ